MTVCLDIVYFIGKAALWNSPCLQCPSEGQLLWAAREGIVSRANCPKEDSVTCLKPLKDYTTACLTETQA